MALIKEIMTPVGYPASYWKVKAIQTVWEKDQRPVTEIMLSGYKDLETYQKENSAALADVPARFDESLGDEPCRKDVYEFLKKAPDWSDAEDA
tara:strand:+ start:580 stop:858 length:279 start_codon:yes stop_codon:yes gene_type:complete